MFRNHRIDSYERMLVVMSASAASRESLNTCGQVLLPPSVLDDISRLSLVFPLQFEVRAPNSPKYTHCGVLEFVALEGHVVMPQWMMNVLGVRGGTRVTLRSVILPKANYIKIQPRQTAFIDDLSDPRTVLETRLQGKYATLTKGDCIVISYLDRTYELDVTKVTSREVGEVPAASIIDTEVQVEFERPLDMPDSPLRATPPCETEAGMTKGVNVIGGGSGLGTGPAISFDPVQQNYRPPSLKSSAGPRDTTGQSTQAASASFVPFSGNGRSLTGSVRPPIPNVPPATATNPPPTAVTPVNPGRTVSGAPPRSAAAPVQPAPPSSTPTGGGGRTLRS